MSLRDVGLEPGPPPCLPAPLHGMRILGTPAVPAPDDDAPSDGIDQLCRGLYGSDWALLVDATPVVRRWSRAART